MFHLIFFILFDCCSSNRYNLQCCFEGIYFFVIRFPLCVELAASLVILFFFKILEFFIFNFPLWFEPATSLGILLFIKFLGFLNFGFPSWFEPATSLEILLFVKKFGFVIFNSPSWFEPVTSPRIFFFLSNRKIWLISSSTSSISDWTKRIRDDLLKYCCINLSSSLKSSGISSVVACQSR